MGASVVETAQVILQTIDQGATAGMAQAEQSMMKLGSAADVASASVARVQQVMTQAGGAGGGAGTARSGMLVNPDDFRRQEQEVQRLLNLMDIIPRKMLSIRDSNAMRQSLLSGHETENALNTVAQRVDFLRTKMFMLQQASGKGWQQFRTDIGAATTTQQLTVIQQKMDEAGVSAGKAAPHFQTLRTHIKSLADQIGQTSPMLQMLIGGFGGAMAFQFLSQGIQRAWQMLTQFIKSIHDLADAQRALHIESIETGLSVETLETLKVAAAETGAEIGQLRMGMRMLTQNMEKHPEAFHALGIEVRNAKGELRSLDEVLPELMDVFAGMTNETERIALASGLLGGRMGARLLPIMTQGTEKMKAFREEGIKLGVILDSTMDKSLTDYARTAAVADLAMEGMWKHIKIQLVPVLEDLLKAIIPLIQWVKQLADNWQEASKWARYYSMFAGGGNLSPSTLKNFTGTGMEMMRSALYQTVHPVPPLPDYHGPKSPGAQARTDPEDIEKWKRVQEALRLLNEQADANALEKLQERVKALGESATDLDRLALASNNVQASLAGWEKAYGDDRAFKMAAYALVVARLRDNFGALAPVVAAATRDVWESLKTTGEQADAAAKKWKELNAEWGKTNVETVITRVNTLAQKFDSGAISASVFARQMRDLNVSFQQAARADVAALPKWLQPTALTESLKTTNGLTEAWVALNNARIDAERAEAKAWLKGLKPDKKVTVPEAKDAEGVLDSYKLSLNSVQDEMREFMREQSRMSTFIGTVWRGIGAAMQAPIDKFMDHVFASKSGWAAFWRILADAAIQQLMRLMETQIMLWLVQLAMNLAVPGGGGIFSGSPAPLGNVAMLSPIPVGPTTETMARMGGASSQGNTYIIKTLSPRDVLMDLTSPNGSLRRATDSLSLASEY
jgi:hypothetical protein